MSLHRRLDQLEAHADRREESQAAVLVYVVGAAPVEVPEGVRVLLPDNGRREERPASVEARP